MINGYCEALSGTLATLVYYGVLAAEDAQCFRVESSIEPGAYVMLGAAILLGLLNKFVMNAEAQYRRDLEGKRDRHRTNASIDRSLPDEDEIQLMQRSLKPPPVLFTDKFRWLLVRQDVVKYTTSTTWRPNRRVLPSTCGETFDETSPSHRKRRPYVSFGGGGADCEYVGQGPLASRDANSIDHDSWRDDLSSSLSDDSSDEPLSSGATTSHGGSAHVGSSVYTTDRSRGPSGSSEQSRPGRRRASFDESSGSASDDGSSIPFSASSSTSNSSRMI
jgi:hypothetical protein